MNTKQLKYVITLAEERNFTAAAERLYVTQPSLSQYISSLEKELGTTLFDRSTKPLSLTVAGEAYLAAAHKILLEEDALLRRIGEIEDLETGRLTIGASTYQTSYLLPKSVAAFHQKYPGIQISIYEDKMETLMEQLQNGGVDLVIGSVSVLPLEFDVEILAEERLYLAVPKEFQVNDILEESRLTYEDMLSRNERFLFAKPVELSLLFGQPFVLTEKGEFGRENRKSLFQRLGADEQNSISVRTVDSAFAYTLAGVGISLVPDSMILFGNFREHPYYYPVAENISTSQICMLLRRQDILPQAVKEYGQVLKDLISVGTWRV